MKQSTDPYALLAYWRQHYDQHGVYPTHRAAAEALGLSSTSVVHYWLVRLAAEGALEHFPMQSQPYRLPRSDR